MSDYLGHIVERYANPTIAIRPEPVSIYEPSRGESPVTPEPIEQDIQIEHVDAAKGRVAPPHAQPLTPATTEPKSSSAAAPQPPAVLPRIEPAARTRTSAEVAPSRSEGIPNVKAPVERGSLAIPQVEPAAMEESPTAPIAAALPRPLTAVRRADAPRAREADEKPVGGRRPAVETEPSRDMAIIVAPAAILTRSARLETTLETVRATTRTQPAAERDMRAAISTSHPFNGAAFRPAGQFEPATPASTPVEPPASRRALQPLAGERRSSRPNRIEAEPAMPAIVEISIGDIEVRAAPPPPPAPAPHHAPTGRPRMSLEDYLRRRSGASGR